eukprot:GSMAST32.ASY1.ANO1.2330.1 assembled CDS
MKANTMKPCLLIISLFSMVVAQPYYTSGMSSTAASLSRASANVVVTEKEIEGQVKDMVWMGAESRTVLLLTEQNTVYRSSDAGRSWTNQTSRLEKFQKEKGIVEIVQSPVNKDFAILVSKDKVHWSTKDCGKTWSTINEKMVFTEMKMHPKDVNLILAAVMSDNCKNKSSEGFCYKNLYLSEDFGATWKFLQHYIVQFEWAHNLERGQADRLPLHAIFATEFNVKSGHQRFGFWDQRIDFVETTDYWKTQPKVLVKRGNRFLFTPKFLFVAQVTAHNSEAVELNLSSDGGQHFHIAKMPFEGLKEHSYTILDTSEDSVFLHVNHIGEKSNWGNIYVSDAEGKGYTLSLPHNRRNLAGTLKGLEGIYLANFIDNVDTC